MSEVLLPAPRRMTPSLISLHLRHHILFGQRYERCYCLSADVVNEVSETVNHHVHDSDCVDVLAEGKDNTTEGKEAQGESEYGCLLSEDFYCLSENNSEFDSESEEPEEESRTAASDDLTT